MFIEIYCTRISGNLQDNEISQFHTHATCSSSNLIYLLTCIQYDSFYVGETENSLSTRMNGHRSSLNNPDNLPLLVAIQTKSHQLHFNSCWNVHVLRNLPPNTNHITCHHHELTYQFVLSSRHTVLVLNSDDFHSILSPSPPFLPSSCLAPLWWNFSETFTWCCLYRVFTYIYSLLIEKNICDHQNILAKLSCVYVCLSTTDLFIFSVRVSSFFSYFFLMSQKSINR